MRMRHKPSTSTRAVPSGNFTILDRRETQPTSCKSSGRGSAISGLRCSTAANRRSPATMSSINFRLGPVSTSSGTTAPGKITMSDRPRMGRFSGNERDDIRGRASDFSAPPRMLTNSVSGEVIVVSITIIIRCRRTGKDSCAANFLRQLELSCFWCAIGVPPARQFAENHSHKSPWPG